MAKIYNNDKGFKIIEVSSEEMVANGCGNICDYCGEPHNGIGYYIAVLNQWLCPTCFREWYQFATNEATPNNADGRIENKNFNFYGNLFGI